MKTSCHKIKLSGHNQKPGVSNPIKNIVSIENGKILYNNHLG